MSDPQIIDCPNQLPDWGQWDPRVRKIVLGKLDGEEKLALAALPEDLAVRFPNLTHLYLWGIAELKALPELPPGLECLEARNCPDLERLPALPGTLETLDVEKCPALTGEPAFDSFPVLDDLNLKGCAGLPESWIRRLLPACPTLRKLDLSDCPQLIQIATWPRHLVDVRLDGCAGLKVLPIRWPVKLRRVGLRGAAKVSQLPDFPATLDYIDLAKTESLQQLPAERGNPRTLFLHGSGVLMPPASEHGAKADENVAARTRAYFEDVALTGKGEVKRCKLLILGNGAAGKTCLSLALAPGQDPKQAEKMGSTHGIQFWDWDFEANTGAFMEPVHLHLWDFGGQEIYHNTHRLFMSKGAVFVVVWNPDQDGREAPTAECGYEDEWRPLRYWLDLIHLACPHKPRIAIVCSHHPAKTDDLEARWKEQAGPEYRDECRCFYVDSFNRAGELAALTKWLEDEVGRVVATQGTAVPAYWEIAQDLVEGWVRRMGEDEAFAGDHNQLHPDRFREALYEAIEQAVANDPDGRYQQLLGAIESGEFELTDDRLRRTLGFLTHSGWVYWDPKLYEERVIVGQQWALDGIYTVLDRRAGSEIYRTLNRMDGRFTLKQLGEWAWDAKGYSRTDQELFLSFMKRCGLCFELRKGPDAWREEDISVSFEHLPTAKEVRLQRDFTSRRRDLPIAEKTIAVPGMHKQHWQSFLIGAGNHYGKDAQYALDGFYLENEEGDKLLMLCHLEPSGLGGEIEFQVGSGDASARLKAAEEHIRGFLPGVEATATGDPSQSLGKQREIQEIFVSYAWDPPADPEGNGIPPGYEAPVNAIDAFLADKAAKLIRDKKYTGFGDNLKQFMEFGASRPHVIVVHSDKYWRSPYCIYELWMVVHELQKRPDRGLLSVVIPIEHLNSEITTEENLEAYLEHWRSYTGTPKLIGWSGQELRDYAVALLRSFSTDLAQHLNLNVRWLKGEEQVMDALAKRLNLLPPSEDV